MGNVSRLIAGWQDKTTIWQLVSTSFGQQSKGTGTFVAGKIDWFIRRPFSPALSVGQVIQKPLDRQ